MTVYTPWGYHTSMKDTSKKSVHRRLKIIAGQVQGVQKMVDEETYCIDVITQISAIRKALSSVEDVMLESHLSTCAVEQMKGTQQKQAIDEIMSVYKLSKKK